MRLKRYMSEFSFICFLQKVFFVPMMPLLKIRDVSGQARLLVSANSLKEVKAKGKHHFFFIKLLLTCI